MSWRMVEYRYKDGQSQAFWADMRENGEPLFALAIDRGLMSGYEILINPFKAGDDDWDVMLILKYPNYAALDNIEARAAKVYLEYFGSQEAVQEASRHRASYRDIVQIKLVEVASAN